MGLGVRSGVAEGVKRSEAHRPQTYGRSDPLVAFERRSEWDSTSLGAFKAVQVVLAFSGRRVCGGRKRAAGSPTEENTQVNLKVPSMFDGPLTCFDLLMNMDVNGASTSRPRVSISVHWSLRLRRTPDREDLWGHHCCSIQVPPT